MFPQLMESSGIHILVLFVESWYCPDYCILHLYPCRYRNGPDIHQSSFPFYSSNSSIVDHPYLQKNTISMPHMGLVHKKSSYIPNQLKPLNFNKRQAHCFETNHNGTPVFLIPKLLAYYQPGFCFNSPP